MSLIFGSIIFLIRITSLFIKKLKFLSKFMIFFTILILCLLISLKINNDNQLDRFKNYLINPIYGKEVELKSILTELIKNGNIKLDDTEISNEDIKKIQNLIIEHLIDVDLNYNINLKRSNFELDIYHFENHPFPPHTLRRRDNEEKDKICYKKWLLSVKKRQNTGNLEKDENNEKLYISEISQMINKITNTKIRARKFQEMFSRGRYHLFGIYDNKNCECLNLAEENVKEFPNNAFLKYQDKLFLKEGGYFIFKEKLNLFPKSKTRYHIIKIYTMQNEIIHYKQKNLKVFYKVIDDIKYLDDELKYLLGLFNLRV